MIPQDFERMTAEEIENVKVDCEKELQSANAHLGIVREQKLQIERQILELRIKQTDYTIMCSKARDVIKRIESDIVVLTSEFWRKKKGMA